MIVSAICLDVARDWGIERLSFLGDSVEHGTLETLGIVRSSVGIPFLNLKTQLGPITLMKGKETYQI